MYRTPVGAVEGFALDGAGDGALPVATGSAVAAAAERAKMLPVFRITIGFALYDVTKLGSPRSPMLLQKGMTLNRARHVACVAQLAQYSANSFTPGLAVAKFLSWAIVSYRSAAG